MPLGVCLSCGGSVLWANLEGEDYAVEAGPVASMNFRKRAVELLDNHLERVDPVDADAALKSERLRIVEGLDKATAESMRDALGVKETTSRVTRGPTPKAGAAGALKGGLPIIGLVVGLALGPFVGWGLGALLGVVGAGGLAAVNMQKTMRVLGQAPVGPMLESDINGLARRIVAAKSKLGEAAGADLTVITNASFEMVAQVIDPDDVVALGAGGMDGGVAQNAIQMATQATLVAEGALRQGRDDWSDEERGSIDRLKAAVTSAMSEMAQLSSGASSIDDLEATMAQEVELARETAQELDYLEM